MNLRLGQYSFPGLMKITATVFILLSPLSISSTMATLKSSQWLEKNILLITGNSRKAWIGALAATK